MQSDSDSPNSNPNRDDKHNSANTSNAGVVTAKRGSKACTACRKGKNRCVNDNGQPPCRRCASTGAHCVFESAPGKGMDEERLERIERSVGGLNDTVTTLLSYLRSAGPHQQLPPANPLNSFDPSSFQRQMAPVLPSPTMRLDPDFNARSPSNPLHWEIQMPEANLADLLGNHASTSSHQQYGQPQPQHNQIPQLYPSQQQHMGADQTHPLAQLQPPVLPPMPPSSRSSSNSNGPSPGSGGQPRYQSGGGMPSVSFSSPGDSTMAGFPTGYNGPTKASSYGSSSTSGSGPNKRQRKTSPTNGHLQSRNHPPLPNYPAPPHPISQYGLVPSNVPSDDEDALPSTSLTAPFEALAEAAAAAASGSATPVHKGRPKKRRRRMPPPPNAFPDVIEKGLVTDELARVIFSYYFLELHKHFPILNPDQFDTYEGMRERTPWSVDSMLSAAAMRMFPRNPEIEEAAEIATEEAMGIARSSLFGPTVRKEGVQAMALLAAFSDNAYLATGHALRMAMELGLHRALGKLSEEGKARQPEEERDLVISARLYMGIVWLDFVISIGSGRPHMYDEDAVTSDKLTCYLQHPLTVTTDKVLVANIELIGCRIRIERGFVATSGTRIAEFVRRGSRDLQTWYKKWDVSMAECFGSDSFERQNLLVTHHCAGIFLATMALKGQSIGDATNLSVEIREIALNARESAHEVVNLWLNSPALKQALRFSAQPTFVDVAFCALLLLKLSRLFPEGAGPLGQVVQQCHDLHVQLRQFPRAERYAMTLKIALERFCRTFNISPPTTLFDLPNDAHNAGLMLGAGDDMLMGSANLFGYDLSDMSDQNWVGSEPVPEWLSNPSSWTFESLDFSGGLNQVFLPSWSTYAGAGEW